MKQIDVLYCGTSATQLTNTDIELWPDFFDDRVAEYYLGNYCSMYKIMSNSEMWISKVDAYSSSGECSWLIWNLIQIIQC